MIRIRDVSFWNLSEFEADKVEETHRAAGTLVVREATSAVTVATAAEAIDARVVVVVDNPGETTGIFIPDEVKTKLSRWQLQLAPMRVTATAAACSHWRSAGCPVSRGMGPRRRVIPAARDAAATCCAWVPRPVGRRPQMVPVQSRI